MSASGFKAWVETDSGCLLLTRERQKDAIRVAREFDASIRQIEKLILSVSLLYVEVRIDVTKELCYTSLFYFNNID